ncbi:hypothetical protein Pmani_036876 [Petrolisthes manimaculis]|uniref:Uncharacterized protein n=1 Tax=Petrolisthes manimaculis TaxID=1843537 RepID=A0AAE1TM94_9EUCA|nr:hypothetical protein Pmani_036876 [Petrolisthes manimaculis]
MEVLVEVVVEVELVVYRKALAATSTDSLTRNETIGEEMGGEGRWVGGEEKGENGKGGWGGEGRDGRWVGGEEMVGMGDGWVGGEEMGGEGRRVGRRREGMEKVDGEEKGVMGDGWVGRKW